MEFDLESTIKTAHLGNYSSFGALALLVYDILLNFDTEVHLVWIRKWTFGKVLAILNRYSGLVLLSLKALSSATYHSKAECTVWGISTGVLMLIALLPAQVILQLRLYAVFDKNRWVLCFTMICCVAQLLGTIKIATAFLPLIGTLTKYHDGPGCYNSLVPSRYFLVFIPPIIYELLLCSLMLFGAWRTHTLSSKPRLPLLNLLIRDSTLYFFSIALANLFACILYAMSPHEGSITEGLQICVPSVVAHRLLLNMRAHFFASQHVIDGTLRIVESAPRLAGDGDEHAI